MDRRIPLIAVPEKRRVYVRIPLDDPRLSRVLDGRPTWHYVMAGAYSPYASGGIMPVKAEAEAGAGGGAPSELCPRVYDILLPEGLSQADTLSSWDEASWSYATAFPVESSPGDSMNGGSEAKKALEEAKTAMEAEAERAELETKARLESESASADPIKRGTALFELGRREEAKAIFSAILEGDPENPYALAYLGSLRAMEGGETKNPAQAVAAVQEGLMLIDRGVESSRKKGDTEGLITSLMARASVRAAVPEAVFGLNALAAEDYVEAAGLLEGTSPDARTAALLEAALCRERAGDSEGARLLFLRILTADGANPRARFELLKRGISFP